MDARFRRHWDRWNERIARGMTPADILAECSDETLVELLASAGDGTSIERNIIATELTNRISRLHASVAGHSERVRGLVDENRRALDEAGAADDRIRTDTDALAEETDKTARYSKGRRRDGGW